MSNNRRKIEKCLAGGENHVTVHTGVNSNNRIQQNLHKLKNTINFFVHTLYLYI